MYSLHPLAFPREYFNFEKCLTRPRFTLALPKHSAVDSTDKCEDVIKVHSLLLNVLFYVAICEPNKRASVIKSECTYTIHKNVHNFTVK